jgi:GNAT superfamily N-acetyltransferase
VIRTAKPSDAEFIAVLSGQLGYPVTPEEMVQRLGGLTDADAVFVAEHGWIHVAERRSLESPTHAEILALIVDVKHRGAGVGRALLDRAAAWARERGLAELRVRSNVVREKARAFYERHGFAVVKTQRVFRMPLSGPRVP